MFELLLLIALGYGGYKVADTVSGAAKRRAEEIAARPKPVPVRKPVPQPTDTDLAAQALERYRKTLRWLERAGLDALELEAARKKAKLAYLRELDGLLK